MTRVASILALVMALWMLKDVFLPGFGPSMMAPAGTHGRMQRAMERGGLAGMLARRASWSASARCPARAPSTSTSWRCSTHRAAGSTGLALLALYNLAFIVPLVLLLLAVSDRRVLGRLGRWNRANSPWVKAGLAFAVIAMSFGLMVTM